MVYVTQVSKMPKLSFNDYTCTSVVVTKKLPLQDFMQHYRHHAPTTFHSSSFSWLTVVYSNTIATATAEQR